MRIHSLLFLLLFVMISNLFAQNDTVVVFYNRKGEPAAGGDEAVKYSLQIKQDDHYKKLMVGAKDDKVESIAYFKDAECKFYDGPYREVYKNGNTHRSGRYYANKKTGIWKTWTDSGKLTDSIVYRDGFIYGTGLEWDWNGNVIDSLQFEANGKGTDHGYWSDGKTKHEGNYLAGKKEGLWVYFYKNGTKCQEVNYLADSAISYTCFDEKGQLQQKDCIYEQEAEFPGGEKSWLKYLLGKLAVATLPAEYYRGEIYGQVWVKFIVDIDGKLTDIKVEESAHPALDKAALNIISHSPKWNHAVQYNRAVKAYRLQPITFAQATE